MTHARIAHVDRPGVVRVSGSDALTFLQSLLSQDLSRLEVGGTSPSLLLTPQGKLTAAFLVHRVGEHELLLDCPAEIAPLLAQALQRFCIRVDVGISDVTGQFAGVRERGGDSPPRDELVPVDAPLPAVGVALVADDEWEARRIERGEPRQPFDIDESTIAQEAFLERDAVSFTKGCFLGQELVCRIDTRGHVNRYLRGLRSSEPLAVGAELLRDGVVVGTVTSTAQHPDLGPVALAVVRREVEPPAELQTAAGASVQVVELPSR